MAWLLVLGGAWTLFAAPAAGGDTAPRYDRDILPILAENCFACHGPDAANRQAELRLDTAGGATADRDGARAIVPGNPQASEMITRVHSTDTAVVMPPPESNKTLTAAEKKLLEEWIAAGAPREAHWAYAALERPELPSGATGTHPVDRLIDAALIREGLVALPAAERNGLARRVAIDLTGLPPEPAEIDAFVADLSPGAYERLVDALLSSPQHAERLAAWWLDLVRYGDSVGYHGDQEISMWPYRDWVIRAFASNMPFDQFTREQLAGDLLPEASRQQKIAASFNRLNLMSAEGGGQDKEYHAKYAGDRVRATSGAWLGSTLGCAECHDHKFDPFTTRDFYAMAAFFADVQERGIYHGAHDNGIWGEMMRLPSPEQAATQADLEAKIAQLKARSDADTPELQGVRDELATLEKELKAVITAQPFMPATVAGPPRIVRVLPRGNWMDDSGAEVLPAPPAFLSQAGRDADAGRLTRLDLARWITGKENPLVARVLANRLWALLFGQGLSRRLDDHGAQGEPPSHPELLDWLACELRDGGWDLRCVLKLLVTSDAYRRASAASGPLVERDPENRWLARQNRYRVDAEMVRDTALAASGLLVKQVGGPSVRPYQPAGYWDYLNFPARTYKADTGDNLYRRGLYVHWQRQYLHPALVVFDAPSREECTARRARSNTPLQALVLLNDPEYVEAARALAAKTLTDGGSDPAGRARFMLRRAIGRVPSEEEIAVLTDLVERQRQSWLGDPKGVRSFLSVGVAPLPLTIDPVELAAWASAARTVLNLHETYSRH
jgi:mono/diheme cytochrome c family protein